MVTPDRESHHVLVEQQIQVHDPRPLGQNSLSVGEPTVYRDCMRNIVPGTETE